MPIDWSDLAAALALYLVIEGVLPFVNPRGMKRAMATFSAMPEGQLRVAGLLAMVAGLLLLWFVRS
ncbi:MAG: DUF2065 domain-containing protein [Steroidobacteraceae bacterium]|nr:DUF2065 domain-containing protein [Steroidobacteraceae bacterium]